MGIKNQATTGCPGAGVGLGFPQHTEVAREPNSDQVVGQRDVVDDRDVGPTPPSAPCGRQSRLAPILRRGDLDLRVS